MIKIEIRITPSHHKDYYDIIECKSLWGWELSRKVDTIWLSPLVFSTELSKQSVCIAYFFCGRIENIFYHIAFI